MESSLQQQRHNKEEKAHTVGLKADGTVVAVGRNYEGQCDTESWRDIGPVLEESVLK